MLKGPNSGLRKDNFALGKGECGRVYSPGQVSCDSEHVLGLSQMRLMLSAGVAPGDRATLGTFLKLFRSGETS